MATVYTRYFAAAKEQSYLFDTEETGDARYRGNGNDRHIPLGRKANGSIYRAAIRFTPDWSSMYQIVAAYLVFRSSSDHVAYGTDPALEVKLIDQSWDAGGGSEGTWGRPTQLSNAIYPGPSATANPVASRTYTGLAGPGDTKTLTITGLIEELAPTSVLRSGGGACGGRDNNGLKLSVPNESVESSRFEMFGMRAEDGGKRPYIEVQFTTNRPPNAPSVTTPAPGGNPSVYASPYANHMAVEAYFSDADAGQYPILAEVEAYADGATDGAPGARMGFWQAAPAGLTTPGHYRSWLTDQQSVWPYWLHPRTHFRFRHRFMDNEGAWGPFTSLADGRVFWAYTPNAPAQNYMEPVTDKPHIYGNLSSNDPHDYITGWKGEFYRDDARGATPVWTNEVGLGGGTYTDIEYKGDSLVNGEIIRWQQWHRNRDGIWSAGTGWIRTQVWTPVGPDNLSPKDTTVKLLSRTPALTIGHSTQFTGYRWRLYINDDVVHDSQETACTATTSVVVYPPAGLLAWGDGLEGKSLKWDAQIRLLNSSRYGVWTPAYSIRINALPGATAAILPAPSESVVKANNVRLWSPYTNEDQQSFNEVPSGREVEFRERDAVEPEPGVDPGSLSPAAGGGPLVERRYSWHHDAWPISPWHDTGFQVDPFDGSTTWTAGAPLAASTVASAPTDYTGSSFRLTATSVPVDADVGTAFAYRDLTGVRDWSGLGSGAWIRCWVRVSTVTNLHSLGLRLASGNSGTSWNLWRLADGTITPNVWTEVVVRVGNIAYSYPAAADPKMDRLTRLYIAVRATGAAYSGTIDIRDLRIGTVPRANGVAGQHLVAGDDYEWRTRFHDDADAILSTTLAAGPSAGATNIKLTSVTGLTVGDALIIGPTGSSDYEAEVRGITNVGTAGSGGTGVDLDDGLAYAHANAEAVVCRPWGGWSDWVWAVYEPPPIVTLQTPSDAGTITDPTPTFTWTVTSGSGTQARALVRIYKRVGSLDSLVWDGSVSGSGTSYTLPGLVLEDGATYAWEVVATDTLGSSDTSDVRFTFTTNFTAPAIITGLTATPDQQQSAVRLAWTASADANFDHYRVYWQTGDGGWDRIDSGPVTAGDGRTPLTATSLTHYGARWGENVYRVVAHTGALTDGASEPAYVVVVVVEADEALDRWLVIAPTEPESVSLLRVSGADRSQEPIRERYDPPGRGSSVHITWGRGPATTRLSAVVLADDIGLVARLDSLMRRGVRVYLKASSEWGWDPLYGVIVSVTDKPRVNGVIDLGMTFERTDAT